VHTTNQTPRIRRSLSLRASRMLLAGVLLTGCQAANDRFLNVVDPDIINADQVNNAESALALANGVVGTFKGATGGGESSWMFGGLLADEWSTSSTFIQNDETDQRRIQLINSSVTGMLRTLYRTRTRADEAIVALKQYAPTSRAVISEMFLARGFSEMQLALDFCNGIPIGVTNLTPPDNGMPKSNVEVFRLAGASVDSAIAYANGTDAQSVLMNRSARVVRARIALALNDYTTAGTLVTGLPTAFNYTHTFSLSTSTNTLWGQALSSRRYSLGDSLEGNAKNILVANAIPFASSRDPRLGTIVYPVSGAINGQDGLTYARTTNIWGQLTPVDVVNGVDARMIEAEVALKNGQVSTWLGIHNALRAAPPKLGDITPAAMPALVDPGTDAGRVNLQFREKAFWTFGRGQRLGDMRRLINQYARTEATVFPQGVHYKGGTYGPDVNLPVTQPEENNPNFKGCTDRKP